MRSLFKIFSLATVVWIGASFVAPHPVVLVIASLCFLAAAFCGFRVFCDWLDDVHEDMGRSSVGRF
jgi:hypothetical protein